METREKFELTPAEITAEWDRAWKAQGEIVFLDYRYTLLLEAIAKAQVVKVLSHFQPVELEALEEEEILREEVEE